jgi:hypothetical protein
MNRIRKEEEVYKKYILGRTLGTIDVDEWTSRILLRDQNRTRMGGILPSDQ